MEDNYTASPGPYALRLCRAASLVAVGAAIHLALPQGGEMRVPAIRPVEIVRADARQPRRPPLLVEQMTIFAPLVGGFRDALSPDAGREPVGTRGSATLLAAYPSAPPAADTALLSAPLPGDASAAVGISGRFPTLDEIEVPAAPPAFVATITLAETPAPVIAAVPPLAEPAADPIRLAPLPVAVRAAAAAVSEETLVRRLLDEYAGAFERLDVSATKAVWPTVNDKALERAYGQIASQRLTLQGCGITISGSTANARCQGSATYQPRIGKRAVVASREWTFDLSKKDAAWRIDALR